MRIVEATIDDKDAITDLCNRSVKNDYVPLFLDTFLSEGGTFIAIEGRLVVGMLKYTRCIGGDGWFGAARTDPEFRRKGIAKALMKAAIGHEMAERAKFVRLWTSRTNRPAVKTLESIGFREVGRFARVRMRIPRKLKRCSLEVDKSQSSIWSHLKSSKILGESGWYAPMSMEFVKVTRKVVSEAATSGRVHRLGDNVCFIDEDAWGEDWKTILEFVPLAGSVRSLFREGSSFGGEHGKKEIQTYLQLGSNAFKTARAMGFKVVPWGREAILYEKSVRGLL